MSERAIQTRQALIQATIDEIERVGLAHITVRGIARRAGANVAAVNYHFGSKADLVDAVLDVTRAHMFEDAQAILARTMTAQEAMQNRPPTPRRSAAKAPKGRAAARPVLVELMTYLLAGAARYPHLTRAQAQRGWNGGEPNALASDFEQLVSQVAGVVRAGVAGLSTPLAEQRSAAALSAILFLGFFPEFFGAASPSTAEARARYVETIVEGLLCRAAARRKPRGR